MSGSNAANNSGGQQPAGENGQEDLPLTSTAQNERSAARSYSFTARAASGNVVYAHTGRDLSIERLLQDFDEGLIEGVPRAACAEDRVYIEVYRLFWGTVELLEGQWLGDYENLPDGAELTLVLTQVEELDGEHR